MSAVVTVVAGVVAFAASILLARPVGRRLKRFGTWAQVLAGAVIVVAATVLVAYGLVQGSDVWRGVGLGLGFGGLGGLRYGGGTLFDLVGRSKTTIDGGARR